MTSRFRPVNPVPPTTNAHAALYDAVYAAPHDDAPRAHLAHVLSDAGDPRGAFLAGQLAAARGERRTKDQDKRERALLKAHSEAWLGPFAPLVRKPDAVFERGFPSVLLFKTVVTEKQIAAFDAVLDAPEWATVRKAGLLLRLSAAMRALEEAYLTIEAVREAVRAGLHEVVPLTSLRIANLGVATQEDLRALLVFPRLRTLYTPVYGDLGFADLLDAAWPALEVLGDGAFVRDFPLWLERRGDSDLRTVCFWHEEFLLRLDGRNAHLSHVRKLLDGELPQLLATLFASGVERVTADARSAPLVTGVAREYGLDVEVVDEPV